MWLSSSCAQERKHQPSLSFRKKNPVIPSAWLLAELLLNMDGAILVASYSFSTIISLPPRALPNLIPFSIDDGPVFCLQKLHLIFVFGCSVMYINFGSYLFIFFFYGRKIQIRPHRKVRHDNDSRPSRWIRFSQSGVSISTIGSRLFGARMRSPWMIWPSRTHVIRNQVNTQNLTHTHE